MVEIETLLRSLTRSGVRLNMEVGSLRYTAPRGVLTPHIVDSMRARKSELVGLLKSAQRYDGERLCSRDPLRPLDFTYQQEWVWGLLSQQNTMDFFIRTYAWRLIGRLDVGTFRESSDMFFNRHESLRTKLMALDGRLVQTIQPRLEQVVRVIQLSGDTNSERRDYAYRFAEEQSSRALEMADYFPVELTLMPVAEFEHVLCISMHHMFTDLTSLALLFRGIWRTYSDVKNGRVTAGGAPELQYADYAAWQRSTRIQWLGEHDDYWRTKLTKVTQSASHCSKRHIGSTGPLAERRAKLPATLGAGVLKLAKSRRVIPAVIGLTAYLLGMCRWFGQREFVIPFNVSGRNLAEHEEMIGPLGYMLFLRLNVSDDMTYASLLRAVTQEFMSAYSHLDFATVAQELPELLRGGFVQWLSWNPSERAGLSESEFEVLAPGMTLEPIAILRPLRDKRMWFDIVLQYLSVESELSICWWYREDLFTLETIDQFSGDIRAIMAQMLATPDEGIRF